MKIVFFAIIAILSSSPVALAAPVEVEENWMVGAWYMTHDEDGDAPDIIEFLADGTQIAWGQPTSCVAKPVKYHVHAGDIYVTIEVPNKGPVAVVFRPDTNRTKLTLTSPVSLNNATYERLAVNPCAAG